MGEHVTFAERPKIVRVEQLQLAESHHDEERLVAALIVCALARASGTIQECVKLTIANTAQVVQTPGRKRRTRLGGGEIEDNFLLRGVVGGDGLVLVVGRSHPLTTS